MKANYILSLLISYPGQALQCWNGACMAEAIINEVVGQQRQAAFVLFTMALLISAGSFLYLGHFRSRARMLYHLYLHRQALIGGSDGKAQSDHRD